MARSVFDRADLVFLSKVPQPVTQDIVGKRKHSPLLRGIWRKPGSAIIGKVDMPALSAFSDRSRQFDKILMKVDRWPFEPHRFCPPDTAEEGDC